MDVMAVRDARVTLAALREELARRWPRATPAVVTAGRVATGVAAVDALLCGGWARGAVTLLVGPAGAGRTGLLLRTLGQQRSRAGPGPPGGVEAFAAPGVLALPAASAVAGAVGVAGVAAWIDVPGSFDPFEAACWGVDLDRLLIVRPLDGAGALSAARRLAAAGLDLVVLDLRALGCDEDGSRQCGQGGRADRSGTASERAREVLRLRRAAEEGGGAVVVIVPSTERGDAGWTGVRRVALVRVGDRWSVRREGMTPVEMEVPMP